MDLNTVLNRTSVDGNGDAIENETKEVSVFGESSLMNIGDVRQYLYLLEPAMPDDRIAASTPSLGKLDIGWKSAMGQSGRLQTAVRIFEFLIFDFHRCFQEKLPVHLYLKYVS
jgi:hypothetical protein